MASLRADPCNSTWFDGRKSVEREGGMVLPVTRADKKQMLSHRIDDIETFISYPRLSDDCKIVFGVEYEDEDEPYMVTLEEIQNIYPKKIGKLLLSTKYTKSEELKQKIDERLVKVQHKYNKGAILYLLYPTEDNKRDRVVRITGYVNEDTFCFDFMQNVIPKYMVQHVQHKQNELEYDTYQILQTLSNGKRLYRGGKGVTSDSDVQQIVDAAVGDNECKYNYLKIQIFLRDEKIKKVMEHCKQIGIQQMMLIGNILKNWLRPKNKEKERCDIITINPEIKNKEFQMLIISKCDDNEWIGTKAKKTLEVDYEDSLLLFGNGCIVQSFKPINGTPFILSITDLVLTHYVNRDRLKIECFVTHIWDDDD